MAKSRVSLKLLIDTQAKRVLFAEASKECVDFLFHLLSLPMATIVSLLKNQGMIGSMINLYKSIENLNESYMLLGRTKDSLLKPALLSQPHDPSVPLLLLEDSKSEKKFYRCSPCSRYECISDDPEAVCPYCFSKMTTCLRFVAGPWKQKGSTEGGFVKGLVTYMVMDNLVVEPMSTISCIIMLNKFNIKDLTSLEEKVVDMGMDEAILLLKASLQSDKVLTDVFLKEYGTESFFHCHGPSGFFASSGRGGPGDRTGGDRRRKAAAQERRLRAGGEAAELEVAGDEYFLARLFA